MPVAYWRRRINLAIQDAVAPANNQAEPVKCDVPTAEELDEVQRRRELPPQTIQYRQVFMQDHILRRVIGSNKPLALPWQMQLLRTFYWLTYIPVRVIGVGIRPEHVKL